MRAIDADALQLAIVEEGQANKRKKYIVGDIWELTGAEIREVINSLPTIQPEPHWIPVEQDSPKIGEYVLCETAKRHFGMYCRYHVCKFVDKDKWIDKPHFDWDRNGFPHVIAWMPLPKSYRG